MAIDSFEGQYEFLSNFYMLRYPISVHGMAFPSVEHAYQAMKSSNMEERARIQSASTPGQAKRLGRRVALRPGWREQRLVIMKRLVTEKFAANKHLIPQLLDTGEEELIEGNWWGDRFWGVYNGEGENHQGKILMELRNVLRIVQSR